MPKRSTISSFHSRFATEDNCVAYLEKVRWNGSPVCPRCNSAKVYRSNTRKNYKCGGCRRTFTVRKGTIFEDSKLPLKLWFTAIYQLTTTKAGVSSVELADRLAITQKTAWFMLQRIQYAISHKSFQKPLTGHVEMDDTEMMRNKEGKRTRIIGMIKRKGEVRSTVVEDIGRSTVHNLVGKNIEKGSTLNTDSFRSYTQIHGYKHDAVNHGVSFTKGDTHTNTVEGYFGNLQRRLHGIHIHVSDRHMQKYCDMYGYRYNLRKLTPVERFETWFASCMTRLTYKELTA